VPLFLTPEEYAVLEAVVDRLIPPADGHPGARALGVADYIDGLLGAFLTDPPRIWARHPRGGGFHRLSPLEELAWRTRIEGSLGIPEREFNGPVVGLQQRYREGLAALGPDFCALTPEEQDARLAANPEFARLVYEHACEGAYGAPAYGGNRDLAGWRAIGYAGDVAPAGYPDAEVSGP
jgi:gluconate 2-dehydrogenase gamma chain